MSFPWLEAMWKHQGEGDRVLGRRFFDLLHCCFHGCSTGAEEW